MTNEQRLQIAAYRKTGMGYKQIAKELDLSANSVKSYCRRNGLSSEALEPVSYTHLDVYKRQPVH